MALQVKILAENAYDSVGPRNYDLIRVRKSGKYGFLDLDGNEVIKRKYTQTLSCSKDGYIYVYLNPGKGQDSLKGVIDVNGNEIVPFYETVQYFGEGLFGVCQGGNYALYDHNKKAFVTDFEYALFGAFLQEGMLAVCKNKKWGYIDTEGRLVIDFLYDSVNGFKDGLAQVGQGPIWKNIDKTGQVVTEPDLTGQKAWEKIQISFAPEGPDLFAPRPIGLADSNTGTIILEHDAKYKKFEMYQMHSYGVSPFIVDGKYGLVDYRGNILVQPRYDFLKFPIYGMGGKFGLLDNTGREVTQPVYEEIDPFDEDVAGARKDGKCGFIDRDGNTVIDFLYDYVGSFFKGLAPVGLDGKYGVIDKSGRHTIELLYDQTKYLDNNKRMLELDGKYMVLDMTTGRMSPPFDEILKEAVATPVRQGALWYLADPRSWEILSEGYARIEWVSNAGFFQYKVNKEDKRWGILRVVEN